MAIRWAWLLVLWACQRDVADRPAYASREAIGTPHPTHVVAVAPNGRWIVACQARIDTDDRPGIEVTTTHDIDYNHYLGDRLTPYLFRGAGDGEAIDGYVARSPDQRWLVIVRDQQLVLVDDATGVERALADSAIRPDLANLGEAAVLDDERVFYLRTRGSVRELVIEQLVSGRARTLAFPHDVIYRVEPATRDHAHVWAVHDERGAPPDPDPPAAKRELARAQTCDGEVAPSHLRSPGHMVDGWLSLATGSLRLDGSVLAYVDDHEVARATDGSIRIDAETIVPARCKAEVLAVSRHPLRVFATCDGDQDAPLERFGHLDHAVLRDFHAPRGFHLEGIKLLERAEPCAEPRSCVAQPLTSHLAGSGLTGPTLGGVRRLPDHGIYADDRGRVLLPARALGHRLYLGPLRWVTARP